VRIDADEDKIQTHSLFRLLVNQKTAICHKTINVTSSILNK
jgi:hypothetical protein